MEAMMPDVTRRTSAPPGAHGRWQLSCPDDHSSLARVNAVYECSVCRRQFPIKDGVVRFVQQNDSFYEGTYRTHIRYAPRHQNLITLLPLWVIGNGYVWTVRKFVKPRSSVIELGCAGGVAWFGQQYRMAGVDLSHQGLACAAGIYDVCLQTDASRLPVSDHTVDAVISSYFWEHIAPEQKPTLLNEIARVLRPGGHVVFVYDVATRNPLIRKLSDIDADLYQNRFIDHDGHVGYQTVRDNELLFRRQGFDVIFSHPMERTFLQGMSVYDKMRAWPGVMGVFGHCMMPLSREPFAVPYAAMLRGVDETIGRMLPRDWGRITLTVAVKR